MTTRAFMGWLLLTYAFFFFLLAMQVLARDLDGQWAQLPQHQRDWLRKQINPQNKMSCCSEADGEQVDEEIRAGRYWIQSAKTNGRWMIVPEEVVIKEPNLHGRPVAWWTIENGFFKIFCYAPGPLL